MDRIFNYILVRTFCYCNSEFGPLAKEKVIGVNVNSPKWTFWRQHFSHWVVLAHQIFTRASDSLRLTSAHTNGDRGPTKNFEDEQHLKFGLKLSVLASITLGVLGVTLANV